MEFIFFDVVGFVQNDHAGSFVWFGNISVLSQGFDSIETFLVREKIASINRRAAVSVRQIVKFGFQSGVLFG